MVELLNKENNNVVGYKLYRTIYKKKENLVTSDYVEVNCFKCVANHTDFAILVQSIITHRELIDINSAIDKLEELAIQNFGLDDEEQTKLDILYARRKVAESIKSDLIIPDSYKEVSISNYPQNVILLANWISGVIPQFPVEKIKTLVNNVTKSLVDNGKADINDNTVKEVADLLKDFYAPIYNTNKDSIFKKWILKFDLIGIRQLILASGIVAKLESGKFTYVLKSDDEIRKNVAHALLRRMQKDNAEIDKKDKTEKASK